MLKILKCSCFSFLFSYNLNVLVCSAFSNDFPILGRLNLPIRNIMFIRVFFASTSQTTQMVNLIWRTTENGWTIPVMLSMPLVKIGCLYHYNLEVFERYLNVHLSNLKFFDKAKWHYFFGWLDFYYSKRRIVLWVILTWAYLFFSFFTIDIMLLEFQLLVFFL